MSRLMAFLAAATLASVGFAQADPSVHTAGGGMRFSAKAMDTDNDGLISRDEFMKYHAQKWREMTKDSNGSMSVDPNNTGTITQAMFMSYEANHWSLLPRDANDQIAVAQLQSVMKARREKAAAAAAAEAGDTSKPD
jgi:hypothetical protein